jgi:hypothetical protein
MCELVDLEVANLDLKPIFLKYLNKVKAFETAKSLGNNNGRQSKNSIQTLSSVNDPQQTIPTVSGD